MAVVLFSSVAVVRVEYCGIQSNTIIPPENEAAFNLLFFMFDAAVWGLFLSFIFLALSSVLSALHLRRLLHAIPGFSLTILVAIVVLALIGPALPPTLWRLSVVHTNDHTYQLVLHYPSIGLYDEGLYLRYECDNWAVTCRELYRHPAPSPNSLWWHQEFRQEFPNQQLVIEQNEVVLYIRGQPVFVYPL